MNGRQNGRRVDRKKKERWASKKAEMQALVSKGGTEGGGRERDAG